MSEEKSVQEHLKDTQEIKATKIADSQRNEQWDPNGPTEPLPTDLDFDDQPVVKGQGKLKANDLTAEDVAHEDKEDQA